MFRSHNAWPWSAFPGWRNSGWSLKTELHSHIVGDGHISSRGGRTTVTVQGAFATTRADNLKKPISDLLVSVGVVEDDSLAEMISIRWVTAGPPITVRIESCGV